MEKKIPEKWTELKLEELIGFALGGDWGKDPNQFWGEDFVDVICIRGSELKDWRSNKGKTASPRKIKASSLEKRKLILGDILLEISGGGPDQPVGRTVIIDKDVLAFKPEIPKICTNFFRLLRIVDPINKAYINYYLQYFYLLPEIVDYQGGSNNLRNLRFSDYITIKTPIPSVDEQNRIATKLDQIFSHLDKLKVRLDSIPELLKQFRQAVLTLAVTGKLTEEWREGKDVSVWKNHTIDNLVGSIKTDIRTGPFGSSLNKSEHRTEGIPVLGIESIGKNGKFTYKNKIFVDHNKALELRSFAVIGGDIIISRSGTVGELCLLPEDIEHSLISTNLLKISLNKKVILPIYFCYLFKGSNEIIQKLNELCQGSTRLFLTQRILKSLDYYIPNIEEQTEIVHRVDSLFAIADKIEKQYKALKVQIDNLPQAILAKAFKGELVDQLPTDGDAQDLLNDITKLRLPNQGKNNYNTNNNKLSRAAEDEVIYKE